MAATRINEPIQPMTLGNMRANSVHSLLVSCHLCHHEAIISAAAWLDEVPVPNWREQPARESLSGAQWR